MDIIKHLEEENLTLKVESKRHNKEMKNRIEKIVTLERLLSKTTKIANETLSCKDLLYLREQCYKLQLHEIEKKNPFK